MAGLKLKPDCKWRDSGMEVFGFWVGGILTVVCIVV